MNWKKISSRINQKAIDNITDISTKNYRKTINVVRTNNRESENFMSKDDITKE